jgi:hypothetical protein
MQAPRLWRGQLAGARHRQKLASLLVSTATIGAVIRDVSYADSSHGLTYAAGARAQHRRLHLDLALCRLSGSMCNALKIAHMTQKQRRCPSPRLHFCLLRRTRCGTSLLRDRWKLRRELSRGSTTKSTPSPLFHLLPKL